MYRKGIVIFFDKQEFKKKQEKEYQGLREVLDFGWYNTKSAGFVTRFEEKRTPLLKPVL